MGIEKRNEQRERLKKWASELEAEDMRELLVELVVGGIDGEEVSFWDDSLNPYWSNTGDPLIKGQKCFEDD